MADIDPSDRPDRFARLNTRWVRVLGALAVVVAAAVVVPTLTSGPNRDETAIQTRDQGPAGGVDLDEDAIDAGIEVPADGTIAPPEGDDGDDEAGEASSTTTTSTTRSTTATTAASGSTTPTTSPTAPSTASPTTAAPVTTVAPPASCAGDAGAANSITASLNSTRSSAGLPALTRTAALDRVAQDWACHMAKNGMGHNPSYQSQVFAACGGCTGVAENVGFNNSADAAWTAWMNSATHKGNILDPRGGKHGVGAARNAQGQLFVVHDFGWN